MAASGLRRSADTGFGAVDDRPLRATLRTPHAARDLAGARVGTSDVHRKHAQPARRPLFVDACGHIDDTLGINETGQR